MKEKEREASNRSNVTSRTKKAIKSYMLYTKETIKGCIHTMQRNCEAVLIKSLFNKSSFKESKNLLFTEKNYETKVEEYVTIMQPASS